MRWLMLSATVALAAASCGRVMTDIDGGSDGRADNAAGEAGQDGGGGGAGCRSATDCVSAGQLCLAPGESAGCGILMPNPSPCTDDSQCTSNGQNRICGPAPCVQGNTCVEGCDVTGCGTGMTCDATRRCVATSCTSAAPCPTNFVCGADQRCARKACRTDGECQGACVKERCYDRAGTCAFLPA